VSAFQDRSWLGEKKEENLVIWLLFSLIKDSPSDYNSFLLLGCLDGGTEGLRKGKCCVLVPCLNFVRIYTKEIPMHYLREQALARGFCNR
jgi:hypothetical protein